jgi:hypothetical protein
MIVKRLKLKKKINLNRNRRKNIIRNGIMGIIRMIMKKKKIKKKKRILK